MPGGPVEVAAYETLPEAYHTKGYLESRGIRAFVADELTGSWMGAYNRSIGGIRVMVAPEDVDRALAELETLEAGRGGAEAEALEPGEAEPEEPEEESHGPGEMGSTAEGDPTGSKFATRTRTFALLSLGAPFLAPFALFRAFSAPSGIEFSPRARSVLLQARLLAGFTTALLALLIRLVFLR